jgi:hypothetical protein
MQNWGENETVMQNWGENETETLLENTNDNGVKVVNFNASKNVNVMRTKFMHQNFHKHNWISPDGKTLRFITSLFF